MDAINHYKTQNPKRKGNLRVVQHFAFPLNQVYGIFDARIPLVQLDRSLESKEVLRRHGCCEAVQSKRSES